MQVGKYYIQEYQTGDPSYFYMKDVKKNGNPSGLIIGGWSGNRKVKQTTVPWQDMWKEIAEKDIPSKILARLKTKI